jgi:hypothetical protein
MFNQTFATPPVILISSSKSSDFDDANKINYHLIEQKLSILPIILTIVGTIGNLIAFYVLTRKKLRRQSTMLYFATLTCMDTLSLYQWYAFLFSIFI